MRQMEINVPLGRVCGLFGKSRQSWYYKQKQQDRRLFEEDVILKLVKENRKLLPRVGGRKLFHMLQEDLGLHHINLGRDKFFELLKSHNMLVKRRKRYVRTTNSNHWMRKYPNLIEGMRLTGSGQVYVSDITYLRIKSGFVYLSLITDAYSKKIMGYYVHPSLTTKGCLMALRMALSAHKSDAILPIHHSDRGLQYCSEEYTTLLIEHGFQISMTQSGSPYDNAVAERINGILKDELLDYKVFKNLTEARVEVKQAVERYNGIRPHLSCGMLTPQQAHSYTGKLQQLW